MKRPHVERMDARLFGIVVVTRAPDGSAYAYLEDVVPLDQSLFDCPANRCAVVELLSPSPLGCVGMSVELDDSELGVLPARGAEDG